MISSSTFPKSGKSAWTHSQCQEAAKQYRDKGNVISCQNPPRQQRNPMSWAAPGPATMAGSKHLSWEGNDRVSLPGTDSLGIRDFLHLCRDAQTGMMQASSPGSPHLLAMRVWQALQVQSFSCFFHNTEMLRNSPPRLLWGWCDCMVGTPS